jgi:hypothetical protein
VKKKVLADLASSITPRRLGSGTATVDQMMIPADPTREPASDAMCSLGNYPMRPRSAVPLHLEHPSQARRCMPMPERTLPSRGADSRENARLDVWHKTVVPACDRAIHTRLLSVPARWTATICRSRCLVLYFVVGRCIVTTGSFTPHCACRSPHILIMTPVETMKRFVFHLELSCCFHQMPVAGAIMR